METTAPLADERRSPTPERTPFKTPVWHKVAEVAIKVMALAAIAAVALIFVFVGREALPLLWEGHGEVSIGDMIWARQWPGYDEAVYIWQPVGGTPKFNVIPLFVGTLKVTVIAMAISIPIGVACALFLSQYASRRVREIVKPVIELLAGIPSVVLGFFVLMIVASWAQDAFGFTYRLNAIVAAIGLSLAIIPVIFTVSEDALQAVPKHLSEAALALGARRYQTTLRVIVPAALPGIAAAIILGFGRAVGETMVVLMASGNAAVVDLFNFSSSVRTVTATIASELGEVGHGDAHWRVLFMLGLVLFAITFVLNVASTWIVRRLQRKLSATGA